MDQAVRAGFEVYLLLPPGDARRWIESRFVYPWFRPEMIADVPASEARRWFVAAAGHDGVPLWFVRMHRRSEKLEGYPATGEEPGGRTDEARPEPPVRTPPDETGGSR